MKQIIIIITIFILALSGVYAQAEACRDSDGGKDYYNKGTCFDSGNYAQGGTDNCYVENGVTYLSELYCGSANLKCILETNYKCPYGCQDGACAKEAVEKVLCSDTDGGREYYKKGTVTWWVADLNEYRTSTDTCRETEEGNNLYSGPLLVESTCEGQAGNQPLGDASSLGTALSVYYYKCPNGCKDGACISMAADECLSDTECMHLICPMVIGQDTPRCAIESKKCYCGGSSACTDLDGGENIYTASSTSAYVDGVTKGTVDNCEFFESTFGVLKEAVCIGNKPDFVSIKCPSEAPYCRYGKCSAEDDKVCKETDGGDNPSLQGTTTEARYGGDQPVQNTDYCENLDNFQPMDECKGDLCGLREYYCTDPFVYTTYRDVKCPSGCVNGVCEGAIEICLMMSMPVPEEGCKYIPKYDNKGCIIGYDKECKIGAVCGNGVCEAGEDELICEKIAATPIEPTVAVATKQKIGSVVEEEVAVGKRLPAKCRFRCPEDCGPRVIPQPPQRPVKPPIPVKDCTADVKRCVKQFIEAAENEGLDYSTVTNDNELYGICKRFSCDSFQSDEEKKCNEKVMECAKARFKGKGNSFKEMMEMVNLIRECDKEVSCSTFVVPTSNPTPVDKCPTGCFYEETYKCVPFGTRIEMGLSTGVGGVCEKVVEGEGKGEEKCYEPPKEVKQAYCSLTGEFFAQKENEDKCQNNWECLSNECGDGECRSTYSLLKKILEWLSSIFGREKAAKMLEAAPESQWLAAGQ